VWYIIYTFAIPSTTYLLFRRHLSPIPPPHTTILTDSQPTPPKLPPELKIFDFPCISPKNFVPLHAQRVANNCNR
jgi:hypothetical protein